MLITAQIQSLIDAALAEDAGGGDPTTNILVPPDLRGRAALVAKSGGVLAGVGVAVAVFARFDPTLTARALMADGDILAAGDRLAEVEGGAASILTAERTAVNFLQRMCGVASETRRYVDAVSEFRAQIVDTRKTTPGLRALEKYAVSVGGARNHRRNLSDGILIKDNHVQALAMRGKGVGDAVKIAAARASHTLKVEIEVDTLAQLREALDAGADLILLDNMRLDEMREAVEIAGGRAVLEASGGVTLDTVADIARTGVDIISVGALTHSAPSLDISLDLAIDG